MRAQNPVWVVKVRWTAPGDDGMLGRAAAYDIRYSLEPLSDVNWDAALQATGEPAPSPAYSTDSFTIMNLLPDTLYYVAVKTRDEAFNWSGISNIVAKKSTISLVSGITDTTTIRPEAVSLRQNYPNPFNPATSIDYSLATAANVRLSVFNALGQRIKSLVDEVMPAGEHTVRWDGTNTWGQAVASGIYFYRLEADEQAYTKQMTLLK